MSPLFPLLLFSAWWEDLEQPHHLANQNFGLGLRPDQLFLPRILDRVQHSMKTLHQGPWSNFIRMNEETAGMTTTDKNKFQVILDVQQFKPEEISAKVVGRYVIVEAKHEEKRDEHGWISRQFVRKYFLPEEVDIDQVSLTVSTDGILTIAAPLREGSTNKDERTIKIEMTGKPALREKSTEEVRKQESQETAGEKQEAKEETKLEEKQQETD